MKRTFISFGLSFFIHLIIFAAFIYFLKSYTKIITSKPEIISVENIKIIQKKKPLPPKKPISKPKPKLKPKPKPKPKKIRKKPVRKKIVKKREVKKKVYTKVSKPIIKKQKDQNTTIAIQPPKIKLTSHAKMITKPKQPQKSYIQTNFAKIQTAIIENKYYPKIAKKLHIQGEVKVSFYLLPSGEIESLTAFGAKSILCKAAKKTILKASKDFPKPKEKVKINVPIVYNLIKR